nr:transposase [Cupriavidus sp. SW-Y-13]
MPRKPKAPLRELPAIPKELIDQFVKGPMTAEAVQDAAMAFKKALIERALGAELGHHLAIQPVPSAWQRQPISATARVLRRADRGRAAAPGHPARSGWQLRSDLDPQTRAALHGFDDKIIAMYARGMTVREIQAFWSSSTARGFARVHQLGDRLVMEEITAWQAVRSRSCTRWCSSMPCGQDARGRRVRNKAVYLALGVLPDDARHPWPMDRNHEGAKFWMKVFNDLKTRGTQDILIAVTDGLKAWSPR